MIIENTKKLNKSVMTKNYSNILVLVHKNSLWKSCLDHQAFLANFYQAQIPDLRQIQCHAKLNYSHSLFKSDSKLAAKNLKIVLASPQINYTEVAHFIGKQDLHSLEVVVHIYGNLYQEQSSFRTLLSMIKKKHGQVKIVSPSSCLTQVCARLMGSRKGLATIPLFIKSSHKTDPVFPGNTIRLGYAGRINHDKNIHLLFEAFQDRAIYSKYSLTIAGSFDSHIYSLQKKNLEMPYIKQIATLYKKLNPEAKKKVVFTGELSKNEMKYFYRSIDCYVNLSTFYGEVFGFGLAEALSHQKNILITKWGGFLDFGLDSSLLIKVKLKKNGSALPDFNDLRTILINGTFNSKEHTLPSQKDLSNLLNTFLRKKGVFDFSAKGKINRQEWSKIFSGEQKIA